MEAFAAQKAELERVAAEKLADAQRRGEKLEGASVTVSHKAGVDGRLFGSVTNADIADALKAQGHDVVKAEIRLPEGPFKAIGEYPVVVALHTDVTANITVVVVGEQ
jgi:large subunit ribosomal protein L9